MLVFRRKVPLVKEAGVAAVIRDSSVMNASMASAGVKSPQPGKCILTFSSLAGCL